MNDTERQSTGTGLEIAVIGMAGRFPGAKNINEFWENLKNGIESISFFTPLELEEAGLDQQLIANPNYVKSAGYLEDTEYFDPAFFNYTPLEAKAMDPQLRIYHECVWEALEDAGCNPETYPGPIGIYSGASVNRAWVIEALRRSKNPSQYFDVYNLNSNSSFGTLISYNLNLKGPSFSLQTACSTSLVAIHLACQGLLNAECDVALAGGVSINPWGKAGYLYQEGMINSPDGHCRVFDARARGTIGGEGVGIVVLKRMEEAVEEGDHIYAVIKGSAINNDGIRKIGYTAPSVDGQSEDIRAALEAAEIEPETISYVEAHGTGTTLGDPIEIEGLKLAFKTGKRNFCGLGAVKSNIGHLDTAAGVAGFIKTVLALKHRMIPPTLHFENPNPEIDFENSPFYVIAQLKEWRGDYPLRAGVSSFGIGGTNAHVILEEYKPTPTSSYPYKKKSEIQISVSDTNPNKRNTNAQNKISTGSVLNFKHSDFELDSNFGFPASYLDGRQYHLIFLSARTQSVLNKMTGNLARHLKENPGINLADVAYTLQVGRKTFKYRGMTSCSTVDEAVENLSPDGIGQLRVHASLEENRPVIFMFPGQGSQYVDMGRSLYEREPRFRQTIERCFEILKPLMGYDLKEVLYPGLFHPHALKRDDSNRSPLGGAVLSPQVPVSGVSAVGEEKGSLSGSTSSEASITSIEGGAFITHHSDLINQTEITQPVIFIIEYALAELLMSWGINPCAMIGHSVGEYTAACLSGVFSLADALTLVALRGKLMQQMPPGTMISADMPEEQLLLLLDKELSLAAVNGPANCVISGSREAVEIFAKQLKEKGFESRFLHTSHAFHSRMMDPLVEEFAAKVRQISLNKPQKPFISNVSGKWISAEEAVDPGYWAAHLRKTVRFSDGLTQLLREEENAVLVEVGPGRILSTLVRQHPDKKAEHFTLNLIRHPKEDAADDQFLIEKMGQLWQRGVKIDWTGFHEGERRLRVPLPTYPFEHQSFALKRGFGEGGFREDSHLDEKPQKPKKRPDITHWFYVPSWKGVPLPTYRKMKMTQQGCWLVLLDECGLGSSLVERLQQEQQRVIAVRRGSAFNKEGEIFFSLNPHKEEDYDTLFKSLKSHSILPDRIIHLWNITKEAENASLQQVDQLLEAAFYDLLHLFRALGRQKISRSLRVEVVSSNLHRVVGNEIICPGKATLLGPIKVIPLEYPHVKCRSIDIELPQASNFRHLLDDLLLEFSTDTSETVVALRSRSRWVQGFEPISLSKTDDDIPRLKQRGIYLVTGGLGGMGLILAGEVAKNWQARLVITDKSEFPAEEEWDHWLAKKKNVPDDPVSLKIRRLRHLEKLGAEILVCCADVADLDQMQAVISQAEERFGPINGVIHAAGLADGGLIQVRTRHQSEAVLAPKVYGTLVLDGLLKSQHLDFFLLCSSLSSVLAPAGQVAYCAANSFLDAFAQYKAAENGTFTLSINWDTWQEVGMAVAAVEQLAGARFVANPLLDICIKENPDRQIYISRFNADQLWVLSEHRILGKATLPGTAYLEMAGAAFKDFTGSEKFEINDLFLLAPLALGDDEQMTIHTVLEKEGNFLKFSIRSRSAWGGDSWQEHARGRISALNDEENGTASLDLQEIAACCDASEVNRPADGSGDYKEYLEVGPRWKNLIMHKFGADQGLAEIKLPDNFVSDLETYRLHPALVDTATAFMLKNYAQKKVYLPFSFKRVRVTGPVPQKIFSYSRAKKNHANLDLSKQNLAFNVIIMDEQGKPMVEIEEFILLEVSPTFGEQRPTFEENSTNPLKDGILPLEGVEVFNRLLVGAPPQVLVSTTDFLERLRFQQLVVRKARMEALPGGKPPEPVHPRPELSSVYVAPVNKSQQKLAEIWQQFLGIDDIGILDDFFELGGDSLKGLTVISEIHKVFNVELSITDFFTTPTIQGLAETINSGRESIYISIIPVEKREYYPLSSAQKRLYFLQQLRPESVFYNIPNILVIEGKLDKSRLEALKNAFTALILRQESLRTSFHLVDGRPVQKIHAPKEIDFKIEYHIARGKGYRAQSETREHIIERFVRPFDLTRGPLMRVEVVGIGNDKHLWLFDIHHIISDATGLAILHEDLFKLYNGEELPPLKVQYRDFSHWQNELFSSGRIKGQRDYWMQVFSDRGPGLKLPADFSRPEVSKFAGKMYLFQLSKEETLRFLEVSSTVGVTLFMNLLAALNVLLFKYTGRSDIVIGSSIAGRPHADLRNIVGMFVNLLAMRNFPDQDLSYVDFLKKVKATALEAFENQDMQFEMLVEELDLKGDTSFNPLFDVCINVQNYEQPRFEVEGLTFSYGGFQYKSAKFDMLLWANQVGDEIHFMLEYSTEIFKPETAQEFAMHLQEIINQVSREEEVKLKDIKLSYRIVNPKVQAPEIDFEF